MPDAKIDEITWAVITAMGWADSECPYHRVNFLEAQTDAEKTVPMVGAPAPRGV